MKKACMIPEAEKIAFNYRDQVVAASVGDPNSQSGGGQSGIGSQTTMGSSSQYCNPVTDFIVDIVFDFGGVSVCA